MSWRIFKPLRFDQVDDLTADDDIENVAKDMRRAADTAQGGRRMSRRFRKKPVVIEATQYDGTDKSWRRIEEWVDNPAIHLDFDDDYFICIPTLEGEMRCSKGDWIIKGIQGEFYPCKPDIFEQTYEAVESEATNE